MLIICGWLRKHSTVVGMVVLAGSVVGLYLMALVSQPWWFLGIVLIPLGPLATWFMHRGEQRQVKTSQVTIKRLKEALEAVEQQASGGSSYMHYDVETGQRLYII